MNPQPKSKPIRDKMFRDFNRKPGEVFHHESGLPDAEKIMGDKCSDYYGFSIPPDWHAEREAPNSGFVTFWAHRLDIYFEGANTKNIVIIELQRIVIKNLIRYILHLRELLKRKK